jgi:anti-sigma28 factor (negative regulator of flagellin synthesis)
VLDSYYQISKSASDDVRWEKVEHFKRTVTAGTYAVPAERVAAKLLRHMLERDRATLRWEYRIKQQVEAG